MFYKDKTSIEIMYIGPNKEPQDSEHHTSALSIILIQIRHGGVQTECKQN